MDKNIPIIIDNHREPHGDNAERIESFQSVQPGAYWRCVKKLPDKNSVKIPVGTVLLLIETKAVDGIITEIVLHGHPSDMYEHRWHLLIDEFLNHFMPEYDGPKIREQEMAAIQKKINDLQAELVEIQANPRRLLESIKDNPDIDKEAGLPESVISEDTSVATAIQDMRHQLERVQKQVNNRAIIAKVQAEMLKTKVEQLSALAKKFEPFFKEKVAAALASCADTLEWAKHLTSGLKTLELYTGKGVEVETLCEGEGADPSEPLTLFQMKLYLDEEHLIHLADGGGDFRDIPSFAKALSEDESLLDRIIPAKRGVRVMAYRRTDKHYSDDSMVNFKVNEQNKIAFLLIRDGQNVYLVYSELATHLQKRLFPTNNEMGAPFRGFREDEIKINEIGFADSRKRHDQIALSYKRVLILLWGLHDRLHLFGEFSLEESLPELRFTDENIQKKIFRFIYDDEGLMLGDGRPRFADWMKEKNKFLQSGSRVACLWDQLLTPDTAPGCCYAPRWSTTGREITQYSPEEESSILIAHKDGKDIVVKPLVAGELRSWEKHGETRTFTATVKLTRYEGTLGFLCLDAVTSEELQYYIYSRRDRENYLRYIKLFIAARDLLRKDESNEAPMVKDIRRALVEGKITHGGDVMEPIREAIRSWRAANRGKAVPATGDADYKPCFHSLLTHLHSLLGAGRDNITLAKELCEKEGRTPLRLVLTGKNRLTLYATPLPDEEENTFFSHPWAMRVDLEQRPRGLSVVNRRWELLTKFNASQTMLQEWPMAGQWEDKKLPPAITMTYKDARLLVEAIGAGEGVLEFFCQEMSDREFENWYRKLKAVTKDLSGKYIEHPNIYIPLAVIQEGGSIRKGHETDREYKTKVIFFSMPLHKLLYRSASEDQRKLLEDYVCRLYSRKDRGLEMLREVHDYCLIKAALEYAQNWKLLSGNMRGETYRLEKGISYVRCEPYEVHYFNGSEIQTPNVKVVMQPDWEKVCELLNVKAEDTIVESSGDDD